MELTITFPIKTEQVWVEPTAWRQGLGGIQDSRYLPVAEGKGESGVGATLVGLAECDNVNYFCAIRSLSGKVPTMHTRKMSSKSKSLFLLPQSSNYPQPRQPE